MLVPSIILAFICSDILKNERSDGFFVNAKNLEMNSMAENINGIHKEGNINNLTSSAATEVEVNPNAAIGHEMMPGKGRLSSGGCGGGCGSACGNAVKSGGCGGCGSGCGGGCGNMVKSGGCGSGCGSGCSGCGGGCGNLLKSSGCGGGGCGGCGGGDFIKGSDSGSITGNGCDVAQSDKSCADAHPKETPFILLNGPVSA